MSDEEDVFSAASQRIGTVLRGKYHIDRVLGIGGMAVVYAATHRNRKRFAVKVLHAELSVRRDIRARFLREGYVANSVNHPGVVAVLDDDVDDDGSAFLVMELLEGATVEALCWRPVGPLAVRDALGVAYQLLDVMQAAHARSIVHRDIKPANLFVSREGQVKVLDFGIARLRDAAAGIKSTRAGAIIGTPGFMAPEQALAQGSDVDPRTDLWAVGATLFTMLSRRFVHEGENGRQMLIRAATVPARSLASVAPDTPPAVVELVARALEFDKALRWESAGAMRDAVGRIHEDMFGPPKRELLESLFEETGRGIEAVPTEPAPQGLSGTAVTRAVVPSAPVSVAAGSDVATTTSRPVSNRMGKSASKRGRAAPVLIAAVVATLVGSGGAFLSSRRSQNGVTVRAAPLQPATSGSDPRRAVMEDEPASAPPPPMAGGEPAATPGARDASTGSGPPAAPAPREPQAPAPVAPPPHPDPSARPVHPPPPLSASPRASGVLAGGARPAASAAPATSQRSPLQIDFQ